MRSPLVSILVISLSAGCVGATNLREHDAMLSTLARAERDHSPALGDEVALGGDSLDRAALVAMVLARNPDLEAARATWRAALAGYPSTVALADPMITYEVAPFSIGSAHPFGQRIELSQKLPYPGKRDLAGASALAEAEAASSDYAELRLELAEATVHAFDDYYVAARALEVNTHHHALLERIQKSATAQYTVGHASQQDPLEAEGELIALERDRLVLETQRRAAVARINRLLRRRPEAPLPPPPAILEVAAGSQAGPAAVHPTQLAAKARIRARASEIAGAQRAFYPDLEVMAAYDSMRDTWQHQWMIGIGIEIPVQRAGRDGAVARARAEAAKATAELASVDDLLAEGRDHVTREIAEATATIQLEEERALPNARMQVDAALAGFTTGQNTFSAVLRAEHSLRDVELMLEEARADLDRRIATLDRLAGRIAGGAR